MKFSTCFTLSRLKKEEESSFDSQSEMECDKRPLKEPCYFVSYGMICSGFLYDRDQQIPFHRLNCPTVIFVHKGVLGNSHTYVCILSLADFMLS